jgi:hypothetical protein
MKHTLSMSLMILAALAAPGWAQSPSAANARTYSTKNVVKALTVVVWPDGFRRREIAIPAGEFSLGVFNQSGIKGLAVAFDRMADAGLQGPVAERLADGAPKGWAGLWAKRLTLTPGTYRLQVVGRPAWVCSVVVK